MNAPRCPHRDNEWDPTAPETFDSPHLVYSELRKTNPLPWSNEYGGFWAATTYDDVLAVAGNDQAFITSVQNVVPPVPRATRRPPLHFDPPEHRHYRAPLDRVLRKSVVDKLEARLREVSEGIVREFVSAGGGNYSTDVALTFAAAAFAALLDLPEELVLTIRRIGIEYTLAIQAMDKERIQASSIKLYDIARDVVDNRRLHPADPDQDLLASLLDATENPDHPISDEMVVASVRQLIVAGIGAPQAVMGSAVAHLARDTALQETLRGDRTLIPRAIEEFLRMYSPYRVFARTAVADTTLSGRFIAAGEPVTMIFPSANRDEKKFPRAQEFVIDRSPNPHLAFGRGAHRCPASAMARLELRIALETLLASTPHFESSGEIEMFSWLEFGPRILPLTVHPCP